MNAFNANIGALVISKQGTPPSATGAGTRTSAGIDRWLGAGNKCDSAVLAVNIGAATGAPTSFTVDTKIQDSADNSVWADYTPDSGSAAIPQQTAGSQLVELDVNLTNARRYVRVSETIAIVGGASPTVPCSSVLVLGGAAQLPV